MGPSGCGKTTLLRLMGAQLRPQRRSLGQRSEPAALSRSDLFDARKHMGVLFQRALFTDLDVFENVASRCAFIPTAGR
jgi:phospholipid/cholesterol/gamma-HCH transport system ATP-binding protein